MASKRATRIDLLCFSTPPMRAFHMSWMAFFLCFFAWFGLAPLMNVVREELALSHEQVGWCLIASVAGTIVARLAVGWFCDRFGPRRTYAGLLVAGALPVMGVGLAETFAAFLVFRLLIGLIGAAFVITQYHTAVMFAPNCVGTASATTAGWGNLGGGVTQFAMPAVFMLLLHLGATQAAAWRLAMVVAGAALLAMGIAYYLLTHDSPEGNLRPPGSSSRQPPPDPGRRAADQHDVHDARGGGFLAACRDVRVAALFVAYAACFGMELTINNVAALYFVDHFECFREMETGQALAIAGLVAGSFGLMNLFARTLGGLYGDRFGMRWGTAGRSAWLFLTLFCEGLALMLFSQADRLATAIPALVLFSLFVQMAEGATFAIVPFINRRSLGVVAGIVGAGGNLGAVAAGFLFKSSLPWPAVLLVLGFLVAACSWLVLLVRFDTVEVEQPSPLLPAAPRVDPVVG